MTALLEVTVQLRAFAERVLFGSHIERDKLSDPGRLYDTNPGPSRDVPASPARPPGLRFGRIDRAPVRLATAALLEKPDGRGRLLHAFANHELLALELMALALLRFPDAPRAWRLGLGATMRDEQRHMQMYVDRMRACGTDLGDTPASSFFWRCIADAPTPLDFVIRMGLVLEQANLDFALHHHRLFQALGDTRTAAVLETVYADEIRHLRHGLHWFDTLRQDGEDAWSTFVCRLAPPLSPARGRGPSFDADGRRRAGMDDEFIARMRVFRRSRGRPPAVHVFHPGVEEAVADGSDQWQAQGAAAALADDLAWLPALLATEDDAVLVPASPGLAFRTAWLDAGLPLPEAIPAGRDLAAIAAGRTWGPLRTWGASPALARRLAPLGTLPVPDADVYDKTMLPELRHALRTALEHPDWVLPDAASVLRSATAVHDQTTSMLRQHEAVVWKAPFSTSGRHRRRVFRPGPDARALSWLDRTLSAHGRVLVEPWLERTADLSVQLQVGQNAQVLGWTRFETTMGGRWTAARLQTPPRGMNAAHARLLTGDGHDARRLDRIGQCLLQVLGPWLADRGYEGPVGVDALIARGPGGLAMVPLVEVNPRPTMGRFALALRAHLAPGAAGRLHLLDPSIVGGPVSTHASLWARASPLTRDDRGRWTGGRLLLTDPEHARQFVAAISLDPRPASG